MGWISIPSFMCEYKPDGQIDRKKTLDKELNLSFKDNGQYEYKLLKSQMYGATCYSAIEKNIKKENNKKVFALITITRVENGELWYKDMDESMWPYYYDCPHSIFKLLTPVEEGSYADSWRKECIRRKQWKHNYTEAKEMKFIAPCDLASGTKKGEVIHLIKIKNGKRLVWTDGEYSYNQLIKNNPGNCTIIK